MTNEIEYKKYNIHFIKNYAGQELSFFKKRKKKLTDLMPKESLQKFWPVIKIKPSPFIDAFVQDYDVYVVSNHAFNGVVKSVLPAEECTSINSPIVKGDVIELIKNERMDKTNHCFIKINALFKSFVIQKNKKDKIMKALKLYYEIFEPGLLSMPIFAESNLKEHKDFFTNFVIDDDGDINLYKTIKNFLSK